MATEASKRAETENRIGAGGFSPDTAIFTTKGPVEVADLTTGDRVYALNGIAGLAKPKLVTAIDQVPFQGELVTISGKRVDFRLHPTHPVLFATRAISNPRFRQAGDLSQQEFYR